MKILEILLPKEMKDKSISQKHATKIDVLQKRMNAYADKIADPKTSAKGREFLKSKLKTDYNELRDVIQTVSEENSVTVNEAVHKLPLTDADFDLVKGLMERPIPAVIAPIYISEIIDDDEFNCLLQEFEEKDPGADMRPHIVDWVKRVMPDQMHRFYGGQTTKQRAGQTSVIHGYDPHEYTGTNTPITGNAYGRM